jgi:hypothetical protein
MHVQNMLPHCLHLHNKVLNAMGNANHQGPSLFQTFPCSLEEELQNTWNQILVDNPPAGNTVADFDALRLFIASSATQEQQHELQCQLRASHKPHKMPIQSFWYSHHCLNRYPSWIPVPEPPLTNAQCKQEFYDAMPQGWQEKFEQTGRDFNGMAVAEVIQYFRTLERAAQCAMAKNTQKQRHESKQHHSNGKGSKQHTGTSKPNKRKQEAEEETADNAPCPCHPNGHHTNGECHQNPKNKKQLTYTNHKHFRRGNGNGKTDGHVAKLKDLTIHDNEDYDSNTTIGFIAQHNKACHEQEALGMIAGTLNELCEGMFTCDSYVDIDCYVNEVLSSSHHTADQLHAYPLEQESECENDLFIESLLQDHALVCEEAYLASSSNINLKPHIYPTQTALRLRSVGLMRVTRIHNAPSGKVLKVLFDTGSGKMLINKSALPNQTIPAKD